MYGIFLAPFMELCERTCESMRTYSDFLQRDIQTRTNQIASQIPDKEDAEVIPLPTTKRHHSYSSTHEVAYYDFPHHHALSRDEWIRERREDFQSHLSDVEKYFLSEPKRIHRAFQRSQKQFNLMVEIYANCLQNPIFQNYRYKQYQSRHIGLQDAEDNVYHAFTFSDEEMLLYRTLNLVLESFEKKQRVMFQQYNKLIEDTGKLKIFYYRAGFIEFDESFDLETLLKFLEKLEQEIQKALKEIQNFKEASSLLAKRYQSSKSNLAPVSDFPNKKIKKK